MGPLIWSRVGVGVLLLLLPLAGALGLLPVSMTQGQPVAIAPSGTAVAVAPTLAAAAPTLAAVAPTAAAALAPTVAAAATTASGAGAPGVASALPAIAFPSGFRITSPTFPLAGTAAPNSKVEVVVDGRPVGTATAGADGKWSLTSITLPAGAKEILVRTVDATGKEMGKSAPIALSSLGFGAAAASAGAAAAATAAATAAPGGAGAGAAAGATVAPGAVATAAGAAAAAAPTLAAALAPTIAAAATAAPGAVATAAAGAVVAQATTASGASAVAITFPSGFRITSATFPVSGTAAPNSKVEVVVDGQPVGTATAGADGKWSLTSITLPSGAKEILVRTVDATGKETGKSAAIDLVGLGFVSVPSALPRTGGDGSLMGLVVAVGLLTLGLGLFLRRRSTNTA